MLLVLLSVLAVVEKAAGDLPLILDGQGDPAATSFVYVSSPYGFYVFDRISQTWGRINQANGLPDNQIILAGLDEGILWVSTPGGLASADIRLSDWQTYDLPGRVEGLGYDDQYVWAGGAFGLRRFNKYSETWETLTDRSVNDLWLENDLVWLATDSGVFRYEGRYQRIEAVSAAGIFACQRIIPTPGRLWFIGEDRLVAYHPATERWSVYPDLPISSAMNLGDSLYVVSLGRIRYYEPTSDLWQEFREIDRLDNAVALYVNAQALLCATDHGLIRYDWQTRTWRKYGEQHGLISDSLCGTYQVGPLLFAISRQGIAMLDSASGVWRHEPFQPSGGRKNKILYVNEDGGHVRVGGGIDLKLQGRGYLSYLGKPDSLTRSSSVNAKLIAQHRSGRMATIFYDDTNKEDTLYGFGYRGGERDLLYRLDAGFLESDYADFDLVPGLYNRGGRLKTRTGPVQTGVQVGQVRSEIHNDFFTGRTRHKTVAMSDLSDLRFRFYYIDSLPRRFTRGFDTLYIDDRNELTDTDATRQGFTVGGLTGDFDPKLAGRDYSIDYERGVVNIMTYNPPPAWMVLAMNGQSYVLQSDLVAGRAIEHIYQLGTAIIPSSFSLVIEDTLGANIPLAMFGIDQDGDGRVDPEFINYDRGLLQFPAAAPFLDSVHVYTLVADYESYSTFYFLSATPVHSGSERVYVDGQLKTRAVDYLLDYTSGILIFMADDAVSDFSEIHVQYARRLRSGSSIFAAGQPVIDLNDHLSIAPGVTRIGDLNLAHLSGRYQTGNGPGSVAFRYVPQICVDDQREWAQMHAVAGQYRRFGFNADYRGYSAGFDGMGTDVISTGRLRHSGSLATSVEPVQFILINGGLRLTRQTDTLGNMGTGRYLSGRVGYVNPRYPQGSIALGQDDLPDHDQDRITLATQYETMLQRTLLKMNASLHDDHIQRSSGADGESRGYLVGAHCGRPGSLMLDGSYQYDNIRERGALIRLERQWRSALSLDAVPGFYYAVSYDQRNREYPGAGNRDLRLDNTLFNNVTIAPGTWLRALTIVNFGLGAGVFFNEYCEDLDVGEHLPKFLINPVQLGEVSSVSQTNSYFGSLLLNPWPGYTVWGRHSVNSTGTAYYGLPTLSPVYLDEARLEFEPKNIGPCMVYGSRQLEPGLPRDEVRTIYGEWNRPWSTVVRTVWSTHWRLQRRDYGTVQTDETDITNALKAILYLRTHSFLTAQAGVRRSVNKTGAPTYALQPSLGVNLNVLMFLYLQFDYEGEIILDSTASHRLTFRVTGQF